MIQVAQNDPKVKDLGLCKEGGQKPFVSIENELFCFKTRIVMLDFQGLREDILKEAHSTSF